MTAYDLLYLAAAPFYGPLLASKMIRRGKYRESLPAMFGRGLGSEIPDMWRGGSVWVHAVSVGEVVAAKAMLPLLRNRFEGMPLLLTTVTETGQAQARSLQPDLADAVRFFPADFSWIVRRFAQTYQPRVFITMETELWPNTIRVFADSGTRLFVFNGKISDKSHRNYRRLGGLFRTTLSRFSAFCMQTPVDAERMVDLCGDPTRVFVTGNCKFDAATDPPCSEATAALRAQCGIAPDARAIVVGSTHPGEEEIALAAFREVVAVNPNAVLLLVPRHPDRFGEVWDLIGRSGFPARRMSDETAACVGAPRVVLVDRMGILATLYAVGEIAVVAGSLVPGIGGHNLLEAAVHGVPVVYGPHMDKQPDMLRILAPERGGTQVDAAGLGSALCGLLAEPARASELGARGREAVLANRGSAAKNMEIMNRFLKGVL